MGCARRLCAAALLAICAVSVECAWAQIRPGIVVEAVAKNSEAEKAGLQERDILLGWSRGDDKGEIASPFDLSLIEIEQAPLGNVILEGLRNEEKQTWLIGPDSWGIAARPSLPSHLLSIYVEGQQQAKAGKLTQAGELWRRAAVEAHGPRFPWLSAWFLSHWAQALADTAQWKRADEVYGRALEEAKRAGAVETIDVDYAWADTFQKRVDWVHAETYYQRAFNESKKLGAESLLGAALLDKQASVDSIPAEAELYGRQALAIQQKLAPGSLAAARTFSILGIRILELGRVTEAEDYERQAQAIQEKLAPRSLDLARTLTYLGVVFEYQGDLSKSEEYLHQSFLLQNEIAPASFDLSVTLHNLSIVALTQGELLKAEEYCRRALAIREQVVPGSFRLADTIDNLSHIEYARGDLAGAEKHAVQALKIIGGTGTWSGANILISLGAIARDRGDHVEAERYFRQALAIQEKLAPQGGVITKTLDDLGEVFQDRGDLTQAERYYERSLKIREKGDPDGLEIAQSLRHLGDVALDHNDLTSAEQRYRQALAMFEKHAPESPDHVSVLASLGLIMRREQQPDAAAQLYEQALDVFEGQTARLGGTEELRSKFRAKYASHYRDYVDLLMAQKKPELAFSVLERQRARTLLETLATAHVDIRKGVEPALLEKERRLQQAFRAKSQHRIEMLSEKHTKNQLSDLEQEIKDILDQNHDVEEQIRASSPSYAALTQPHALEVRQVQQQLLDHDTVLLEYSLGKEHSYVFAVTSDSLAAYELPKQTAIESLARDVYRLVTAATGSGGSQGSVGTNREMQLNQALTALSGMVLGPVATQIKGKRLLVVSDGALQYIPFAMLPVPAESNTVKLNDNGHAVPLIVEHEIVSLPSASVLAVLRREVLGRKEASKAVIVLADPVFSKRDERVRAGAKMLVPEQESTSGVKAEAAYFSADRLNRSVADITGKRRVAAYLSRLPFSRREAQAILEVTPAGEGAQALDFDASRARATSPELAQYRIVHFATHGLLDSNHPELSGLVLSLVDKDGKKLDGVLGLEDIYNLNLPADLVVLSACETGLGREIQGEGLLGLTRGFMYAGASRVVASLWSVDDEATAELMGRFYRAMEKEQMRPAAALRQAQIETWKQKRWADPYYWAAFQLQGEWK